MKSGAQAKRDGSPMAAARLVPAKAGAGTGDHVQATERTQVLHQWEQRPGRDLLTQIAINTIAPLFAHTHGLDTFLQHDLLRRLRKGLIGKPPPVRLCPGCPVAGIDTLVTQQKRTNCWRAVRTARTAARRVRIRSRIASCAVSGTQTAVSSPPRCNTARLAASRLSFFCRSPLLRGIIEGATTMQSLPSLVRVR
jgi:hypothetical protein